MRLGKQLRLPLLVFTFANVLFVFTRTTLDPSIGRRTITPFVFPPAVPLPQWQRVASQPLPNLAVERAPYGKIVLSGMQYSYRQNDLPLDIQMRYELSTLGDVKQITSSNTTIRFGVNQPAIAIRQQEGLGFYGLYTYQQRAYLDACINPQGGSTFTSDQFDSNRIQYDFQLTRLIPWLLGQQGLRDNRCLWTHLSIPLNQSSPESAYVMLEQAWFSWSKWWSSRFPKL